MGVLVVLYVYLLSIMVFFVVWFWSGYVGIELILCKYIDMFGMVYIYNGY